MKEVLGRTSSIFVLRPVASKTKTYHGRIGTGRRTAGRRGGGPARTGRRQIGSSRKQPFPVPSKASYITVLNVLSDARTSEILRKPAEEQNPRWTSRTKRALRSWLLTNGQAPFCFRKPFYSRHVPRPQYVIVESLPYSVFGAEHCVENRNRFRCGNQLNHSVYKCLSNPKRGHTTGESGRGGARRGCERRGGAGTGSMGCRRG